MRPPFENTLWSRLEACAEPVAESLTSDKMLVVPLFGNLSLTYSTSLWGSILILTTPSECALSFILCKMRHASLQNSEQNQHENQKLYI